MLVSAIMPTRNRHRFVEQAVACFRMQDWPDRELVIVDDGEPVGHLVDGTPRVTYVHLGDRARRTIGEKRNFACQLARGEVIVHWDDDDWSAPTRMSEQVRLLRQSGRPATGYNTLPFAWDELQRAWLYLGPRGYALGTSLCYLRAYWAAHRFEHIQIGEDNRFIEGLGDRIITDAGQSIVARIHDGSTSNSKNTELLAATWTGGAGEAWKEINYQSLALSGYPVAHDDSTPQTVRSEPKNEHIGAMQDCRGGGIPVAQPGEHHAGTVDAPGRIPSGSGAGVGAERRVLRGRRERRNESSGGWA